MSLPVPANKTDWHSLLIGLVLATNAIAMLGLAALILFYPAMAKEDPAAGSMTLPLLAGGLTFSALLLIPAVYLNGRKFLNLPQMPVSLPAIHQAASSAILVALWILSLVIGQLVLSQPATAMLLPFINIIAIGAPIVLFLRVALQKLELPRAQYSWSVFGITLSIGPVIGILAEMLVFVLIIFIVGIYAAYHRGLADQLVQLAQAVQNTRDPDLLMTAAAPLLFTPLGLLVLLGLFSVAVPAIEEATKVAALWLFAGKISHPMHGFVLGVLSGAAFALAENLGFASTGATDWVATAALRASSALPHMLNSGILGWALVTAWQKHSYFKLGAAYTAAILIHGTWNAISLAIWLISLLPYAQHAPTFLGSSNPFLVGWLVMILGTLVGLGYSNRALRLLMPVPLVYNEPPSSTTTGEPRGDSEIPH